MSSTSRIVLLVGAADDLFAAVAEAFDRSGAVVALAAPASQRLDRLAASLREGLIAADTDDAVERARRAVARTVDRLGRVDVLVNLPPLPLPIRSSELSAADVDAAIEAGLIAPMEATKAAVREMRRRGRGQIVNCTTPSHLIGYPMMAPYNAAMAAFSSWTRVMQAEWFGTEITVTEFVSTPPSPTTSEILSGGITAALLRGSRPGDVAVRIVAVTQRPRPFGYSALRVRALSLMGVWTRLRLALGGDLVKHLSRRTGLPVFPAMRREGERTFGSTEAERESPPAAATANPDRLSEVSSTPLIAASAGRTDSSGRRRRARAAVAPANGGGEATSGSKSRKPVPASAPALSPEAIERVRAAAERAAVAAQSPPTRRRGKGPARRPASGGESSDS